jgi:type I restriction enzyme S subunit
MMQYNKYKETEYKWLGKIPSHWRWLYLSQTCREQDIKNTDNIVKNVLSLSYGQIIRKKNIDFGLSPKDYGTYQIVDNGNIILRFTDLQNDHKSLRTGLVHERGIITSAYTCLKPFENPAYLQYLLHSYDTQKYFYGLGGGVRQSIGYKDVRYIKVTLPPREEQDQIVRFLDWKVSQINRLINAKRRQIELLREQKRVVINERICDADNYKRCKLKNLAFFKSGTNLTSIEIEPNGKYPVYGGNGLRGYYPTFSHTGEYLLVGRQGALCGNVHYVNGEFWATEHAITVKPYNNADIKWLYYMLINMNLNQYSMAAAQPGLSVEYIVNLPAYFPPNDEQCSIAEYLDKKCSKIDMIVDKLNNEISLFIEYRTRLISDVVTGKVDVRDVAVSEFEAIEDSVNNEQEEMEEEE